MKKRYLIMLIIAIILVLALGAGFAFAYFFTDIFRSNKELFSKYISQNKEIIEIFKDKDIKAYSEKQKSTPYTSEGTIKTNVTFPDSSNAQLATALQNCNITFSGKVDNSSKYVYETIKANYSDTESMQFDLYRNNDIYAGKINDVLFKYVGIENNNLKEFATKMQLPENIISAIPNKIDLNELFNTSNVFSDEEISSLKEKYLKIITDNLSDDMFSKEKSSEDTIYTLTLNKEQLKNIYIKILESLKEDETIINKFKELLVNKYNFTEDKVQTYITQYKDTIQKSIDNSDFSSDNKIIIKVHSTKGVLSKTEINIENLGDFVISKSDDGVKFEIINESHTIASAYAQKLKSPTETKFEFAFSKQDSQIFDLMVGFSGLDSDSVHESSELTFDYDLGNSAITDAKTKFVSTYNVTKTFGDIQKQEVQNSEILLINTAPSFANVQTLYNTIGAKTAQLNTAKLKAIGLTEEQNPFMYYVPSIVPVSATYFMQNPDKSPYLTIPAVLGGISVSMLAGDNSILSRATEAENIAELTTVKEEIMLKINETKAYTLASNYSSKDTMYLILNDILKNFTTNHENVEYSYIDNIVTIRSKTDPTKIITGTLSQDGKINWN